MEDYTKKLGRVLNQDGSITFLKDYKRVNKVSLVDIGEFEGGCGTTPEYRYKLVEKEVIKIKAGETVTEMDLIFKNVRFDGSPPTLVDCRSAAAIKNDIRIPWSMINWVMGRIN